MDPQQKYQHLQSPPPQPLSQPEPRPTQPQPRPTQPLPRPTQPLPQPQPQLAMSAPPQPPPPQPPAAPPDLDPSQYAQVANPTPNLVPVPVSNHPPYAQMITEAITALKDRNGSSKRAIAKYIERVYANSNLPATHAALLTHNLKKLKDEGSLVMVKHSYKLARSSPAGPLPANVNGPKRSVGRPPKPKGAVPPVQPVQAATVVAGVGPIPVSVQVTGSVPVPESFFASLGLVDAPVPVPVSAAAAGPGPVHVPVVKRKPGRPRKVGAGGFGLQPTATLAKKAPGRPRKVAAKNAAPPGTGVVIPVAPPKKAPGRARKVAAKNAAPPGTGVVIPVATSKLKADGTPAKRRGRPPRKNVQILGQIPVPVSVAPPAGSTLVPNVYVGEGVLAAAPAPAVKRRGRPPRAQNGPSGPNVPKTPRKLTGKPLGRPKKVAPAAGLQGPSMQQTLAFNEMRSKLDFFQTSIKQSVGILKPCLDGSSSASAVGALRQLEELANLDLGSVSVQGQQPPAQS